MHERQRPSRQRDRQRRRFEPCRPRSRAARPEGEGAHAGRSGARNDDGEQNGLDTDHGTGDMDIEHRQEPLTTV